MPTRDTLSPRTAAMLAGLRRALRAEGWSAPRAARSIGVGEATVKRWLQGRGAGLADLDALAALVGLEFADFAGPPDTALARELTLAQEKALSEDDAASFLFNVVLSGENPDDIVAELDTTPAAVAAALGKLERLALIERRGGRWRALVDRAIVWRKAPLRRRGDAMIKEQVMAMDFGAPDTVYQTDTVKLSAQGVATLAEMLERQRRAVHALVDKDRRDSHLPRRWHLVLLAAHPMMFTRFPG